MGTHEPPSNNALFESGYWVLDVDAGARHQRKQIEYIRKIRCDCFIRRYMAYTPSQRPRSTHLKRRLMGTRRLALLPNRAAIWVHVAANVLKLKIIKNITKMDDIIKKQHFHIFFLKLFQDSCKPNTMCKGSSRTYKEVLKPLVAFY